MSATVARSELAPGFTISRVLTGLWQISRRGEGLMHLYTDTDLEYIATVSLRTDLKILFRTIPAALSRSGS